MQMERFPLRFHSYPQSISLGQAGRGRRYFQRAGFRATATDACGWREPDAGRFWIPAVLPMAIGSPANPEQ